MLSSMRLTYRNPLHILSLLPPSFLHVQRLMNVSHP
ncbi:hypothetical protein 1013_scaffold47_00001 [Bacteriophage sp.]|nr:hypothetical protein 1013_scaffold47_00001 [Bacteriophage sp.]